MERVNKPRQYSLNFVSQACALLVLKQGSQVQITCFQSFVKLNQHALYVYIDSELHKLVKIN